MAFLPLLLVHLFLISYTTTTFATVHPPAPAPAPHHHHHHHVAHSPAPSPGYKHPPRHSPAMSPGHKHPPSHSPASSPGQKHPPSHSPAMSPGYKPPHKPANPPSYHRKKVLAVQGYVFCKPCKTAANHTLKGATPLQGAVLKLKCNTKNGLTETTTTHHNGFFWISAKNQTKEVFRKCKVFLVSSPSKNCTAATNLHGGVSGATLIPEIKGTDHRMPFEQFHVGPFAFAPVKKDCHY